MYYTEIANKSGLTMNTLHSATCVVEVLNLPFLSKYTQCMQYND